MKITGTFYDAFSSGRYSQHVELSDHVIVGGDKAHVVKIGRKYIEILFYAGQPTKGRMKVDPLSLLVTFPGTQHV